MRKIIVSIVMCSSLFTVIALFSRDSLAAELKKGANYVALGSSFAAGPGIASQLGYCGRSDNNYSHLVADALGLKLTDVTCNGATIANILYTSQGDAAPQIDSVSPDTALVTVPLGAMTYGTPHQLSLAQEQRQTIIALLILIRQ